MKFLTSQRMKSVRTWEPSLTSSFAYVWVGRVLHFTCSVSWHRMGSVEKLIKWDPAELTSFFIMHMIFLALCTGPHTQNINYPGERPLCSVHQLSQPMHAVPPSLHWVLSEERDMQARGKTSQCTTHHSSFNAPFFSSLLEAVKRMVITCHWTSHLFPWQPLSSCTRLWLLVSTFNPALEKGLQMLPSGILSS